MTRINCDMEDCVHIDKDRVCQKDHIFLILNDHLSAECEDYKDITLGEDYQEKYFLRCKIEKTGRVEKREAKGKKIEMHGLTFYTQEDIRFRNDYRMTEEKTGLVLSREDLEDNNKLAIIRKKVEETTPVKDLPGLNEKGGL